MTASARSYGTRQESKQWKQKPNRKARLPIILTEDVPNLGSKGQIVKVKHGYGRNWLLPQKKAVYATPDNKVHYDAWEARTGIRSAANPVEYIADFLSTKLLSIEKEPKMRWAVHEQDISTALRKQFQLHVPLDCIEIETPIVTMGEHSFDVRLNDSTLVTVALNVSPQVPKKRKKEKQTDSQHTDLGIPT